MSARPERSPSLEWALVQLRKAVEEADNPVAAARVVRRVGARHPLAHEGQRQAFRWEAEKLLLPFFDNDARIAKAVVWLCCDAAWEVPRAR